LTGEGKKGEKRSRNQTREKEGKLSLQMVRVKITRPSRADGILVGNIRERIGTSYTRSSNFLRRCTAARGKQLVSLEKKDYYLEARRVK